MSPKGGQFPITSRPPQSCAYATGGSLPEKARGPARCVDLWKVHVRILLARGQLEQAVESYRRWARDNGPDSEAFRHLLTSFISWGLHHPQPEIRIAAIHAARLSEESGLNPDLALRLADPDQVVRAWAAVALSGTAEGARVLRLQVNSTEPGAREVVARQIGRVLGTEAIPALVRLSYDPEPRVRAATAIGLKEIQSRRALPVLRELLRDADHRVRAQAVSVLGRKTCQVARDALDDPRIEVRRAAVSALGWCGAGEGEGLELRKVARGSDISLALAAGLQLARSGAVQPLLNAVARGLRSRRWTVRAAALDATASMITDRVALQLARRGIGDPDPWVRLSAARALLAHRDSKKAAEIAASLRRRSCGSLASGMEPICLQAARLLGEAGHESGLAALRQLARQGARFTTRIVALRSALDHGAGPGLALKALSDPDPRVGLSAATWLHQKRL